MKNEHRAIGREKRKKKKEEEEGGKNEKRNGKNIREGASVIKVPVHRSSCAIKRVT